MYMKYIKNIHTHTTKHIMQRTHNIELNLYIARTKPKLSHRNCLTQRVCKLISGSALKMCHNYKTANKMVCANI